MRNGRKAIAADSLPKCSTGIHGLDEITFGGLPRGRPTLVCGGPGCGKTLMGLEFLARGATQFQEPGVCLTFEETAEEATANVASLGFGLDELVRRKLLVIDHVFVERSLVEETGEYDLEALFVRLGYAVDSIGAKRVLIDSVETLFSGLPNESILRAELRRLFRWLKAKNLTALITAERGEGFLTRHGLEEYISDCVILLDHRVNEAMLTRRLRIVKYRGSAHGTNEYPFLIDQDGISVFPLTSLSLKHVATDERIASGVPDLDAMLGGTGFFRGSTILVSGTAGTGKTSLAGHLVEAACSRGERALVFAFEESGAQIERNLRSLGLDLKRWIDKGRLRIHAERPTTLGLEMHLVRMHRSVEEFNPSVVVVDPVTALLQSGAGMETRNMLMRMIDFLKQRGITAMMTSLTSGGGPREQTDVEVSSLVDVWLLLRDIESGGERNRGLYILKARGLAHSNQIREFLMTSQGLKLRDVYTGQGELLTGSARVAQEARDRSAALLAREDAEGKQLSAEHRQKALEAQIAALQVQLATEQQNIRQMHLQEDLKAQEVEHRQLAMTRSRGLNVIAARQGPGTVRRKGKRK